MRYDDGLGDNTYDDAERVAPPRAGNGHDAVAEDEDEEEEVERNAARTYSERALATMVESKQASMVSFALNV